MFESFFAQDMEDRHGTEVDQLRLKLTEVDENCLIERRAHATTQEDLAKLQQVLLPCRNAQFASCSLRSSSLSVFFSLALSQEMDELKDEFVREKAVLSSQLRERQEEIQTLHTKVSW